MAAGSFAFGFALVPLYDVVCEVTGIGSRDRLTRAGDVDGQSPVDGPRTVVVEFTASVPAGGLDLRAGRRDHGSAAGAAVRDALPRAQPRRRAR